METSMAGKAPIVLKKYDQEPQELREKGREQTTATEIQIPKANQAPLSEQYCSTPSTSASSPESTLASSSASTGSSADTKVHPHTTPSSAQQSPKTHAPNIPTPLSGAEPSHLKQPGLGLLDPSYASDPKYVQMAAHMTAYYQQRCQAILTYQQQRCQAWAASQRQKCNETTQAAMLVVAWYIRDRIGRRRRRNKRSFRQGLREKDHVAHAQRQQRRRGGGGPGKDETVRKWVMGVVPEAALSLNANGVRDDAGLLDEEERTFDVEKEVVPDKDTHMFTVADQMIKSQLAKIDVPLLGALNLDASDSESEGEDESDDGRFYYDQEDDDDDDMDYEEESGENFGEVDSKEAMDGTGKKV